MYCIQCNGWMNGMGLHQAITALTTVGVVLVLEPRIISYIGLDQVINGHISFHGNNYSRTTVKILYFAWY